MRKKKMAESQMAVHTHTHTHTLIFTLIGIIILIIVAGIIMVNKTNIIDEVQARISELSVGNDEESLESEDEEKSVADSTIEDGYYDEENKVTWHVEEDGSMCPIPDGYVGSQVESESNINTGYVIYEGEEEVTEENVEEAKITRNQYVWIPVPDVSQIYGIDSEGKKWGKLYSFSTANGITANNWKEIDGVMSLLSSTGYREPDVASSYDTDSSLITLGLGVNTTHEFLIQLEKEFNSMIESIEKYGGFYVGRYETGNVTQDMAVVLQGNTDIVYTTWYNSYKICKTLTKDNENVETGLIYGCQWDRILIWLIESGSKTIEEITNSSSWGNHSDSTFQYTKSNGEISTKNAGSWIMIPTGSTEYTNSNNIYDLAGNVWEWTMEGSDKRVDRGGVFSTGGSYSVTNRSVHYSRDPNSNSNLVGCRAMLYIK